MHLLDTYAIDVNQLNAQERAALRASINALETEARRLLADVRRDFDRHQALIDQELQRANTFTGAIGQMIERAFGNDPFENPYWGVSGDVRTAEYLADLLRLIHCAGRRF